MTTQWTSVAGILVMLAILTVTAVIAAFTWILSSGLPLAPSRRPDLARLGLKSMIGGLLTCYLTACIAGIFGG